MRAVSIPARATSAAPLRSRRILALAGDGRLVEQVRRGNDAAFEVVFERHGPAILAFCRHMLGSQEEAEDAVQLTFAAAYRDLERGGDREIALKPWLFTIARNRCLSMLRARRDVPADADALESGAQSGAGLAEQVEERAELRRLLADVRELPDEQRAALLLTELGDLSHAEVAGVLDCEVSRVKGLVFRARSALIAQREARETPCESIREQLANLRGGALRRTELRLHLRECPGCSAYREQVRQQRRMLAAALPVAPTLGLKSSVLAAIGIGGGSAGGMMAAGSIGGATLAKVAVAGVLAGGGMVAGDAVMDSEQRAAVPAHTADGKAASASDREAAARRAAAVARGRPARAAGGAPPGADGTRGVSRSPDRLGLERGRGPIEAPPASTPVKRGPPDKPSKSEQGANTEPRGLAKGRAKQAKPNGGRMATGGPGAKGLANAESKAGPKANGGPIANGRTGTNGGLARRRNPLLGRTHERSARLNTRARPDSRAEADGRTRPLDTAKPNSATRAPATPEVKADAAPPAGAPPDPAVP